MLSLFASRLDTVINPQWLKLIMSRTVFQGPKDVRAIEVRLYVEKELFLIICNSNIETCGKDKRGEKILTKCYNIKIKKTKR